MKKSINFIILFILCGYIVLSQTEMQTDWSGGAGISGPVLHWGNIFDMELGVDWYGLPGALTLEYSSPVEHLVTGTYTRCSHSVPADLDGDGDIDIVGSAGQYGPPYFYSGRIDWWENIDGMGTTWTRHDVDPNFTSAPSVCSADLDGDEDMDIIGAAYGTINNISWWENLDGTGINLLQHDIPTSVENASSIDTADVNQDGFIDLISTDSYNEVVWIENIDGTGTNWVEHNVGYLDTPYDVYAADIDGDGDIDLVAAAFNGDDISWFENLDGNGTSWTDHDVSNNFNGARAVHAGDIDGDGDIDVVGAASLGWEVAWWENADGSGNTWIEHLISDNVNYAFSVFTSDVNGDGDMDVLGAGFYNDAIIWWENDGGMGLNWHENIITNNFDGARDVTVADMDDDGDPDILGAAQEAGDITWWDVTCCVGNGELVSSILDLQIEAQWDSIVWNSEEPEGTSLYFQVRSSTDPLYMGSWSENIYMPTGLGDFLMDGDKYVQYRAILETTDPGLSPILTEVSLSWSEYVGIDRLDNWTNKQSAIRIYPNPARNITDFQLMIADLGRVVVKIFDLHGKELATVLDKKLPAGEHRVSFDPGRFSPGVYFYCFTTDNQSFTGKLVVVR